MAMWPLRVYTRKKRAGQRLNLTPTPDLRLPTKTEASSALGGKSCRAEGWRGSPKNLEARLWQAVILNPIILSQAGRDQARSKVCRGLGRRLSRAALGWRGA